MADPEQPPHDDRDSVSPSPEVTPHARPHEAAFAPDFSLEDDDDDWAAIAPRRRGLNLHHPLLLILVFFGSLSLLWRSWPPVQQLFNTQEVQDCGDLNERPYLRAEGKPLPEISGGMWCRLSGVVGSLTIYATGSPKEGADFRSRDEGRKYYLKMQGADIFAVIDAGQEEVIQYRIKKGNLFGYELDAVGRVIDLKDNPGFTETERFLRHNFRVPDDRSIQLFDTTEDPTRRWPYAVVFGLMALTSVLSLLGLLRVWLRRRAQAA